MKLFRNYYFYSSHPHSHRHPHPFRGSSSEVEHQLPKLRVGGSIPLSRSICPGCIVRGFFIDVRKFFSNFILFHPNCSVKSWPSELQEDENNCHLICSPDLNCRFNTRPG